MPANLAGKPVRDESGGEADQTAEDVSRGGDEADAGVADAQRGLELRQDQQGT